MSRKPNNKPQQRENRQTIAPNQTSKVVQPIQNTNILLCVNTCVTEVLDWTVVLFYEGGQRRVLCYSSGVETRAEEQTRSTQTDMEEND